MTDQDALLWSHVPPPKARSTRKADFLYALTKGDRRLTCELVYHGEFGVEAMFQIDGRLHMARTFPMREMAVIWAEVNATTCCGKAGMTPAFRREAKWLNKLNAD